MNRRIILSVLCLAGLSAPAWCADPQTPAASEQTTGATAADLEALKQKIAAQQEQIKKLQAAMDEQQKLLEQSLQNMQAEAARTTTKNGTPVVEASTSTQGGPVRLVPALSGGPNSRAYAGQPSGNAQNPCESDDASPTYIRIGNVCVVPIGFMDLTGVWRNVNAGSSIGTNFGSIPLNSNINARNSEFRFSPQNSRIGFRIDGDWKGTHFIGYNEFEAVRRN